MTTIVKLAFDPTSISSESECRRVFDAGGIPLKFWALYKQRFLTDQHFSESIDELIRYFNAAYNPRDEDVQLYQTIHEFMAILKRCGLMHRLHDPEMQKWVIDHWDYFNLNVQRSVRIEYEVVEPVIKEFLIPEFKAPLFDF